jgi:hypothetical protein
MDRSPLARVRAQLAVLVAALAAHASHAEARELDLGVPELEARLDGTLRYNVGVRTDPVDEKIAANPVFTGGETRVERWGVTTNRLDLLAELDLAWAGRYGARVSGAGWYDDAYRGSHAAQSASVAARGIPSTYVGGEFSSFTLDRYRGPYGELLDAFAFARLDAGAVPVTVKAGRHTLYWGESLMQGGAIHGVSYSQMPLDLAKGAATPGVEAKELFRPLAGVSAQAQLTPALSVAGQVFLEWEPYLYAEGGTFLGGADFTFSGPDGVFRPPLAPGGARMFIRNGGTSEPREAGDFGVALRFRPEWLQGTLGLYYRRFTDKVAAVLLTDNPGGAGPMSPALDSPLQYRQYYGEDVSLVGASFARQILGASVGAEVSFRRDQPLLAQPLGFAVPHPAVAAAELFPRGLPRLFGNSYQARGDTLHAVANALGVLSGVRLFDTANWALEVSYSRWLDVRENADVFFGEGYGVCRSTPALEAADLARDADDGCATRDHVALGAGFTPTWLRAFSQVDLLVPMSATWTIHGNSPVMLGGNEGSGTWGAGIAADVANRYRLELRYVDWFGDWQDDGTRLTSSNGIFGVLENRGNVTFTAKATF